MKAIFHTKFFVNLINLQDVINDYLHGKITSSVTLIYMVSHLGKWVEIYCGDWLIIVAVPFGS